MIAGRLQGRMGNHLFIYCFTRIVAEANGYEWKIVDGTDAPTSLLHQPRWYADSLFDCQLDYTDRRDYSNVYYDANDGKGYDDNNFVVNDIESISDNTLLRGIFQSKDVVEKINPDWLPVKPVQLPPISDDTCVVHYRGRDYYEYFEHKGMNGKYRLYFPEAQERMDSVYGRKMRYLVVTDDIPRAKEFIRADEYVAGSLHEDFYRIYSAKYVILPVSTFSWWAAFLSKNLELCVAPSGWEFYQPKQKIHTDMVYTDKFTWI